MLYQIRLEQKSLNSQQKRELGNLRVNFQVMDMITERLKHLESILMKKTNKKTMTMNI